MLIKTKVSHYAKRISNKYFRDAKGDRIEDSVAFARSFSANQLKKYSFFFFHFQLGHKHNKSE